MTAHAPEPAPSLVAAGASRPQHLGPASVSVLCPFLLNADDRWRSVHASRDHRCHAVDPAVALAVTKQRSLCLTAGHRSCATFVAARRGFGGAVQEAGAGGADLWPEVHTSPVVLEQAHIRLGVLPVGGPRGSAQVVLAGLMVVALLVLVLARFVAPQIDGPATGPSATQPGGASGPTASPPTTPVRSAAPSPDASPVKPSATATSAAVAPSPAAASLPAPSPSAVPDPSITTRAYTVRAGDTLSLIASRFDTTVSALAALNGISDPRLIRIGQVLRVPSP